MRAVPGDQGLHYLLVAVILLAQHGDLAVLVVQPDGDQQRGEKDDQHQGHPDDRPNRQRAV